MIGANAAGLGFVDGVPAADIHHVSGGVRSSGFQWNSRPWYSVSAWIARRFARFFFDFFDFFVFLGLFSPSARCFLFGALVDPYPPGVILDLGTILAMLN